MFFVCSFTELGASFCWSLLVFDASGNLIRFHMVGWYCFGAETVISLSLLRVVGRDISLTQKFYISFKMYKTSPFLFFSDKTINRLITRRSHYL